MNAARFCIAFWLIRAAAPACTCVDFPDAVAAMRLASAVFRGTVLKSDVLAQHPEMGGRRLERTVKLHDLDPGVDCLGASYQEGREYLIFASKSTSRDVKPDDDFFWYGWTDVLPAGTLMLQSITACMPGGETSDAVVRKQLRRLGRGQTPNRAQRIFDSVFESGRRTGT